MPYVQGLEITVLLSSAMLLSIVHGSTSTPPSCGEAELSVEAHCLLQSNAGRSMTIDHVPLLSADSLDGGIDLKKVPAPHDSPLNWSFFLGVCLDMVILAIIAEGWRRFHRNRTSKVSPRAGPVPEQEESQREAPSAAEATRAQLEDSSFDKLPLHSAVWQDNPERCRALLERKPTSAKRMLKDVDVWGRTPLHLSALVGNAALSRLLIEFDAPLDAQDAWDHTPLHFAAHSGSVAICKLLIDSGAKLNVLDAQDRAPLYTAAKLGHEAVCELLLDSGGMLVNEAHDLKDEDIPPLLSALMVQRVFRESNTFVLAETADESASRTPV